MAYVHPVYHGGKNHPEMVTDEYLTCALCQVPGFKEPKTLLCGHIFCCPCLATFAQRYVDPHRVGVMPCPTCCRHNKIPAGGVAALRDNIFVDTQVDRLLLRHNKERGRDDTRYNIHCYRTDDRFHASFPPQ